MSKKFIAEVASWLVIAGLVLGTMFGATLIVDTIIVVYWVMSVLATFIFTLFLWLFFRGEETLQDVKYKKDSVYNYIKAGLLVISFVYAGANVLAGVALAVILYGVVFKHIVTRHREGN